MEEQKLTKLKSCPFCGGEPKKWFWIENEEWAYISIQCKKCNAEIKRRESFSCVSANNPGNAFIKVEKNAVEAWNREPNTATLQLNCNLIATDCNANQRKK